MGERQGCLFEPRFNRSVKVQATDDRITSDAGLMLLRQADHRLGITESLARRLFDPCDPERIRYLMVELLRERVDFLAMGYSAQDDADRLTHDPAMRMAAWNRTGDQTRDERMARLMPSWRIASPKTQTRESPRGVFAFAFLLQGISVRWSGNLRVLNEIPTADRPLHVDGSPQDDPVGSLTYRSYPH